MPSPQGGFAFPVAAHFDGRHCDGSGGFVLGSRGQLCAHVDGAEPSPRLGFNLARTHGSSELEGGDRAIGDYCGGDASCHDHVAVGGLLDDDASLGQYGELQALSAIGSQARRFDLARSCLDIDVGHFGHGRFDSHFATLVGATLGHVVACIDLGLAHLQGHDIRRFGRARLKTRAG